MTSVNNSQQCIYLKGQNGQNTIMTIEVYKNLDFYGVRVRGLFLYKNILKFPLYFPCVIIYVFNTMYNLSVIKNI